MPRLVFLALLLAYSTVAQESPLQIAERVNNRMMELYNAGKFEQMAAELYTEDAVSEFEGTGLIARGHDEIAKIFRSYAGHIELKKIELGQIIDNSLFSVVIIWEITPAGKETQLYWCDEAFVNGKVAYERSRVI